MSSRKHTASIQNSHYVPSGLARAAFVAASNGLSIGAGPSSIKTADGLKSRDSRYSLAALWSMAAENDVEVDDELTKAQKKLRDLKLRISSQSKRNFVLERDVRYLDSRIALLIQNRMALSEQQEVASHLEELEMGEGHIPDDRRRQLYANLFYLLQSEPRHIAGLARIVSLSEIDTLLQTVMFTIFGNQYEAREEYLLLSMFQNVLSAEFEGATDFGSLMRANTPISRMMTTYTRRGPGQSYLKNVLAERLNKMIELKDLDLEINPLKVYDQMIKDIEIATGQTCNLPRGITAEAALKNTDVQAIIAPRRKYSDASDSQICSLIGGFFMLRFINPAIVTPQAYIIVDGTPQKNTRRTLTLLAKLLQNLANKPSYAKEPYMMALAPFIEHNKPIFNQFLNELCEIGDFNESLECPDEESHLRICLVDLGPAPPQVPRLENKQISLQLFSRWDQTNQVETPSAAGADQQTYGDFLYMDTKALFVQILRLAPGLASQKPVMLGKVVEFAATSRDAALVRKGLKIGDMLLELERLGLVDASNGHSLMVEEILKELVHLGNLKDKINTEMESLEAVYKTIQDHNDYLRSQLETYKAYLYNVRNNSGISAKKTAHHKNMAPIKFTHQKLEQEGIIVESNIPENRRSNIYFTISSPNPGTYMIALCFKGRDKPILEMDLKLDDLLEKQQLGVQTLDVEYVTLSVAKMLALLNNSFNKK
ncbi:hypothetical protein BDEG_20313 [Batrachochytrium dendrobatidis JEL423]|uniref:Ras-GAP domain-containing protein n=1 Tax=Batrachochytrium dendrobatidis (strain JEL423) TaxID=403673 RepID=A0A177W9N8_BATDL|nr:hypothetical protein BDEG_20313 [Batrachochytrium dendrobatidis JEL423]